MKEGLLAERIAQSPEAARGDASGDVATWVSISYACKPQTGSWRFRKAVLHSV
ncbi:hypothetical protein EVA_19021 [gut metagenome]|uniref:Uncharacterized protein n=1 Tax=gut metagenome TaxID=749906 RepID=J9FTH4_9ZZZZ